MKERAEEKGIKERNANTEEGEEGKRRRAEKTEIKTGRIKGEKGRGEG